MKFGSLGMRFLLLNCITNSNICNMSFNYSHCLLLCSSTTTHLSCMFNICYFFLYLLCSQVILLSLRYTNGDITIWILIFLIILLHVKLPEFAKNSRSPSHFERLTKTHISLYLVNPSKLTHMFRSWMGSQRKKRENKKSKSPKFISNFFVFCYFGTKPMSLYYYYFC